MKEIIGYFIRNKLFMFLSTIFIFLAGIFSLLSLKRDSLPNVEIKQLVISTTFPGASPEDVELRVTYPIEEKIKEVDGIDEVRSVSRNSVSDIDVRIDLDDKDPDKIIADVRRAVDSVQNLPVQVTEKPRITERKSGSFPIFDISIYGGKTENDLQQYAIFLEEELEKVEGVARVDVFGKRDHEWHILLNPEKLNKNTIDIFDVIRSVQGRSINLPAGSLESENSKDIRIDGEFSKTEELLQLPIKTNEFLSHIKIFDLGEVKDSYSSPKFLAVANGKPGLILSVVKKANSDAINTVDRVKIKLEELKTSMPSEIKSFILNDEAERTKIRLNVVINNAILGFIIVFVILFLFMDTKTALLTSISLPLALLLTFIFLPGMGVTFNIISMMGIIISLGMLVDNSIVISENIFNYTEEGIGTIEASIKGASEMVVPIFGSYLTTVAAFIPMLSMSGIMGKFIQQIPIIVIIALSASLFESFFLLPARLSFFGGLKHEREKSKFRQKLDLFFDKLDYGFSKFTVILINNKYKSFLVLLIILISAFIAMSKMKFILFPKENVEIVLIKVEFNPSLRATATREKIQPVEKIIQSLPKDELVSYSVKIGVQQTDPDDPLSRYGEQLAMVTVFLTPETERQRKAAEIIDSIEPELRKIDGIMNMFIEEQVPAPPIGAAITLSILGKDYEEIKVISKEIREYMATIPGVISIRDDYKYGKKQMVVKLDHNLEILTGVSTFTAAEVIRSVYDGNKVSTLRRGKEKIYIRVLYDEEFRRDSEKIKDIPIRNRYDSITKLSSISNIIERESPELLSHRNYERAVTVSADIDIRLITSTEANSIVATKFSQEIPKRFPGSSLVFGGEEKDTQKSMVSLAKAGVFAIFGIFAILALTMNSITKPIAILSSIPLGIVGIVIGFPLSGKSISFIAMIGIIGLAGVLVNASIVLVDCIVQINKTSTLSYDEILAESIRRRFRPILLTTLTTMGGLLPTAYSVGGSDPLLIPMTLALGWGLGFGTFGSLLYIPLLFSIANDIKSKIVKKVKIESQ